MTLTNHWNRVRYRLYAPIYDVVARPLDRGRQRAIERLDPDQDDRILIVGCGPGMDLDYLPDESTVVAIDLTPTMVRRTRNRAATLDQTVTGGIADAQTLPFADDSFDAIILHLVLSVVPNPQAVVAEAARVLAPGGRVSVYDKFSPANDEPSRIRQLVNPLARFLFADLNRPLEPMFADTSLTFEQRETFLGGLYTVTTAVRSE